MSISRVLSAAVLIVIVGGTIWFLPPWATLALAALAAMLAAVELCGLARSAGSTAPPLLAATAAALSAMSISAATATPNAASSEAFAVVAIAATLAAGLATLASTRPGPAVFASMATLLLAPLYVGVPLGTIAWIRAAHGPAALVWLIAVISLSDTAQYYTGTMFGRRKLSPIVSPGKTVEGAVGGFVAAYITGALLAPWALPFTSAMSAGILALGLALFGIGGDLFESLLKRSAGQKDSSTLIPGHGGVLDRIDAYLFAAPVFYVYLRYLS